MKLAAPPLLISLLALVLLTTPASASVQIGQACTTPVTGPDRIFQEAINEGTSYVVPTDGVMTRWGTNQNLGNNPYFARAEVATHLLGSNWRLDGVSDWEVVPQSPVGQTYSTRVVVKQGQTLGLAGSAGSLMCTYGSTDDKIRHQNVNAVPAVGATFVLSQSLSYRVGVTADIEADADGDGYGDETQDRCIQSAAFHDPCPVLAISNSLAPAKGAIAITATTNLDASLTATASVKLPKIGKKKASTVVFSSTPTAFTAGQLTTLKLKLASKVKTALAATKKSKKFKFTVSLTGNGLANTATVTKSISLPGAKK